ncbi:UNVERIFIED_CONTAM: ROK family transcriptional regulator [Streptococcus canis]|uniref:ROK family transcriptional regulator n=1 Tax=Streptococcus canis TaxID=1329 RepID=UPI000B8B578C|nr:ROK family transcriptional regulator [Streptococcus canis]MDW7797103.1 ROK family transcriptional regulator [Streptococcus canis]MDW7799508.1 ROK family transcriptional regulator [Streptococcus canis]QJD12519.1 ROK family transcriptional regulator [Streptococcus canis]VTR80208.1 putative ROK family protein [Streptococcus canis]GFG48387.1 sugar kinase [Streptococcus canis]
MLSKKQLIQSQKIVNSLYLHGPMSRADLARLLHITPATITEITAYLISKKILFEENGGLKDLKTGRKKIPLQIVADHAYFIGVEISEVKIVCCLTDSVGRVISSTVITQDSNYSFPLSETDVLKIIVDFIEVNNDYVVRAIGIAIPGHYDKTKDIILSNREIWSQFQISKIKNNINIPVYVKNNVKCMALAKLYYDSYKDILNFVFVNLKRGIFAAYVYQGELYGDSNYLVGEVGHSVMNPNGEQCECGKAGCLQTYSSLSWIVKKSRLAYESGRTQFLSHLVDSVDDLTIEHIIQAYRMGEELIYQIIDQSVLYLAQLINNLLIFVDVETIYIHGKLFEEELIAEKLRKKLEASKSIIDADRKVKRVILPYKANFGALGASALALRQTILSK